ncbi:di-trans,poly-cis-decaprenylcistransferase [bacterium]|nr:di-trans,poly-cis-decaprenylcistransferase [bacterium]|tara:strand:- start:1735 stop:2409 length:675 start_codon:yes stop_codon:yes gene_type:complete
MIPKCIGIILDGNRRWAREKGVPSVKGHEAGYKRLKEVFSWVKDAGAKTLIVYAFSTENWNRKQEEVAYLLTLFRDAVKNEMDSFKDAGARIRFAGDIKRFPKDLQQSIVEVEDETKENTEITLVICFSYGGRTEILHVAEELVKTGEVPVSEEAFEKHLWTAGVPDPDMIIRTGGEKRLSGFLAWQSVYSELFFTDTLWPDFSKDEFEVMIQEFGERERRQGK